MDVTATEPGAPSFLTAWPTGDARPLASNLNAVAGQTVPNFVVVQVGAGGNVELFDNAGSTHVITDVAGWYGPDGGTPGGGTHRWHRGASSTPGRRRRSAQPGRSSSR